MNRKLVQTVALFVLLMLAVTIPVGASSVIQTMMEDMH